MNETTDPNNQILLVAIIAFYWALLGGWSHFPPRSREDKAKRDDAPPDRRQRTHFLGGQALGWDSKDRPEFRRRRLLAGAKAACEAILRAFADSDFQTLKRLVGPGVLDAFERAIAGRRHRDEVPQLTFIDTSQARIIDALEQDGITEIVVRYVSGAVSVTRLANNTIVAGDSRQIVEVIDTWTFACETPSATRNWILIATEGE